MAKAPDPKQVAAQMAAEEQRRLAAELKAEREKLVVWVGLGDERRVLRDVDIKGTHVRMLREQAGMTTPAMWQSVWQAMIQPDAMVPLDVILVLWWMAGLQIGTVELLEDVLDIHSHADAPWVHYPSDEELATDSGGDPFDPPA